MLSESTVGQRIAYYRKLKGLKQKELAELAGIQENYLDRIETGEKTVGILRLTRIAWALDVSLRELLGHGE
ncbi:MAG TPA: helix-turn-helix domain-containing protein [Desulfitobacteriaceae bacterium]|nr:helix-turn-helix domain-containing protein [Desulfitobacteriaceae bacterium]